jgi:hypothetical protein
MSRLSHFSLVLLLISPATAWCQNSKNTVAVMPRPADFPNPPKTDKSLFFVQRNRNKNTVVYDVNTSKNGKFLTSKPIDVYWLKYANTGERAELTWLQRTFAFGYNFKKDHTGNGYWVTLTAYDGRKIHLEKTSDGKPVATITINGKYCQLNNIWVYADESGSWPKVLHVDLFGKNMITGKEEFERIYNK